MSGWLFFLTALFLCMWFTQLADLRAHRKHDRHVVIRVMSDELTDAQVDNIAQRIGAALDRPLPKEPRG